MIDSQSSQLVSSTFRTRLFQKIRWKIIEEDFWSPHAHTYTLTLTTTPTCTQTTTPHALIHTATPNSHKHTTIPTCTHTYTSQIKSPSKISEQLRRSAHPLGIFSH